MYVCMYVYVCTLYVLCMYVCNYEHIHIGIDVL